MPPTMLAPVPTKPRSNPFRRRRGAAPLLLDQTATATGALEEGKRPAESSTSASSSFYSEVISASSTSLAAYQRPEKRTRRQDEDEARPAASECSQVIGGGRAHPAEVEVSESSCLVSVLESDLACPERLADDAEATEYSSACDELTPSETEEEVLSGPCYGAQYSLSPLISDPLTDDDDDGAPSPTFNLFLDFAEQFVHCVHPQAHDATNAAHDFLTVSGFPCDFCQICGHWILLNWSQRCLIWQIVMVVVGILVRGGGLRTWTTRRATTSSGGASGARRLRATTLGRTSPWLAATVLSSWSNVSSW